MATQDVRKVVEGAIRITIAVGECIRDIGHPIPSGELYARLMAGGMSYNSYNTIIDTLKRARLIKVSGHLIEWIGPAKPEESRAEQAGNEPK